MYTKSEKSNPFSLEKKGEKKEKKNLNKMFERLEYLTGQY
jgi:hypothetical protein